MSSLPHSPAVRIALLALLLSACTEDGADSGFIVDEDKADNSSGSRWRMPAEILAVGDLQQVDYAGAGNWTGDCPDEFSPGAKALKEYLQNKYPQITDILGFSCRAIVGRPNKASVHSTGRALDIMVPVGFGAEADNRKGDPISNFLVANAEDIGIQFIIWDRTSWAAHRREGNKERYYSGSHPHNDHLHIELSEESGRGETLWLGEGWIGDEPEGSTEPPPVPTPPTEPDPIEELPEEPDEDPIDEEAPTVPPVGEVEPEAPRPSGECESLPAEGGTIDTSSCIWLRGPANYWHHENDGHGGSLAWTRALQSGTHLSSAEWEILLDKAGNYEVQVYLEPEFATHSKARYFLSHGQSVSQFEADLSGERYPGSQWLSLGSFAFTAEQGQKLVLFDNSDAAISGPARVVVDAIRLIPEDAEPLVDPEDPEEPPSSPQPDPNPDPSNPDPGNPDGEVISGCQSGPGKSLPPISTLVLLLVLVAIRRRAEHK